MLYSRHAGLDLCVDHCSPHVRSLCLLTPTIPSASTVHRADRQSRPARSPAERQQVTEGDVGGTLRSTARVAALSTPAAPQRPKLHRLHSATSTHRHKGDHEALIALELAIDRGPAFRYVERWSRSEQEKGACRRSVARDGCCDRVRQPRLRRARRGSWHHRCECSRSCW